LFSVISTGGDFLVIAKIMETDEKIQSLTTEVEEILTMIEQKETRHSVGNKMQDIEKQLSHIHPGKNKKVFHDRAGGKKIVLHERNSLMLKMIDLIDQHKKLSKYPEDLNHILHIKLRDLMALKRKEKN
jgi:tetrahydromethanopterin S-methyltransferase subunit B